jgi:hypothetical protein
LRDKNVIGAWRNPSCVKGFFHYGAVTCARRDCSTRPWLLIPQIIELSHRKLVRRTSYDDLSFISLKAHANHACDNGPGIGNSTERRRILATIALDSKAPIAISSLQRLVARCNKAASIRPFGEILPNTASAEAGTGGGAEKLIIPYRCHAFYV